MTDVVSSPAELRGSRKTAPLFYRAVATLRRLSQHWWLRIWTALAAAAVGYAFSYVVSANELRMRFFFFSTVSIALFIVMSGIAGQRHRKRH